MRDQYFRSKVLRKLNGPKTNIKIENWPKKGETVVNCAFLRSKTQILRNLWKLLRDRAVAWSQLLEALINQCSSFCCPVISEFCPPFTQACAQPLCPFPLLSLWERGKVVWIKKDKLGNVLFFEEWTLAIILNSYNPWNLLILMAL